MSNLLCCSSSLANWREVLTMKNGSSDVLLVYYVVYYIVYYVVYYVVY